MMKLFAREWGKGAPLLALHPLGLDSSAFADLGRALAPLGIRTVAVDLPGFGQSEAGDGPLTPERLAAPVIRRARRMRVRPALLGYSMGGRVALEALLRAPEVFRSGIVIAPYLPWLRLRWALPLAHLMSPELALRLRVELCWPLLKWIADRAMTAPRLREDSLAQSGARLIYNLSCPSTRAAVVSAAREMALDPPDLWTRLHDLEVPTTFVWGQRDSLVPIRFAYRLAREAPELRQVQVPCMQHGVNGPHARCLAALVASILVPAHFPRTAHAPGAAFGAAPCTTSPSRRSVA